MPTRRPSREAVAEPPEEGRKEHVCNHEGRGQRTELDEDVGIVRVENARIEPDLRQCRGQDLPVDVVEEIDAQKHAPRRGRLAGRHSPDRRMGRV